MSQINTNRLSDKTDLLKIKEFIVDLPGAHMTLGARDNILTNIGLRSGIIRCKAAILEKS